MQQRPIQADEGVDAQRIRVLAGIPRRKIRWVESCWRDVGDVTCFATKKPAFHGLVRANSYLVPEEMGRGFPETNGTAFVQALVMAEEAGIAGS